MRADMSPELSLIEGILSAAYAAPGELAAKLLSHFKTLPRLLRATARELTEVVGRDCAVYLSLVCAVALRRKLSLYPCGRSYTEQEYHEYFGALFALCPTETIYAVLLDHRDRMLCVERVGEGVINASMLYPRKLCEVALYHKAAAVRLAHNHPGGFAVPSAEDIVATTTARRALEGVGVRLLSHEIYSDENHGPVLPNL